MAGGFNSVSDLTSLVVRSLASKASGQLSKIDKDRNGTVTQEEFKGGAKAFTALDANQDGIIDATDFQHLFTPDTESGQSPLQKLLEKSMQHLVEDRDQDGDGALSAEEFGGSEEEFARIDRDGDGLLNASELASDFIDRHPELAVQVELLEGILNSLSTSGNETDDSSSMQKTASEMFEKFVTTRDRDDDGGLSREELGMEKDEFAKLDADKDGLVTADELTRSFMQEIQGETDYSIYDFLQALMTRLNDFQQTDKSTETPAYPTGGSVDVTG